MEQDKNQLPTALSPSSLLPEQPEIPPHDLVMDDLYGVGPNKPLGYLPVMTIYKHGEKPDALARLSQERGLSIFWLEPTDRDRMRRWDDMGSLYVYDDLALANLLQQNADVLARHGWPAMLADFVARVAAEHVDPKRQADLFRLIAWAFNDPRAEYARPQPGESLRVRMSAGWLGRAASTLFRK